LDTEWAWLVGDGGNQRLTVLWLRPHRRAIDRTDRPFCASRRYLRTSSGVTADMTAFSGAVKLAYVECLGPSVVCVRGQGSRISRVRVGSWRV